MVEPGDDFGGYMENMAAAEFDASERQQMLDNHEIWRQTTWGGWVVRQIQAITSHFQPFFDHIAEMMRDDENIGKRLLFFSVRLMIIFIGMVFVYAIGRLLSSIMGGDIVIEEEVVIVHEHETPEAAAKARSATSRGKKKRQKEE